MVKKMLCSFHSFCGNNFSLETIIKAHICFMLTICDQYSKKCQKNVVLAYFHGISAQKNTIIGYN